MAKLKVFISHSSKDRVLVDAIVDSLRKVGIDTFDESGVNPGDRWNRRILNELEECDALIVVLSPEAVSSAWVRQEYLFALDRGKTIIPIIIRPTSLPLPLISFKTIDATTNFNNAIRQLTKTLGTNPELQNPPQSQGVSSQEEEIMFTAFYSTKQTVDKWSTLLVYAHLLSTIEVIRSDANKFKEEIGDSIRESKGTNLEQANVRGIDFTIVPSYPGITFTPNSISFIWLEDWHRFAFRVKADGQLINSAVNVRVNIFAGPLLFATIRLPMIILEQEDSLREGDKKKVSSDMDMREEEAVFPKVFPSYSRKDKAIVHICRRIYRALRLKYLLDIDTILCGDILDEKLKNLIEEADVFQIFWSKNAAKSPFVRNEWTYALKQRKLRIEEKSVDKKTRELFICGVYWNEPLHYVPSELRDFVFDYLHIPILWRWYARIFR